MDIGVADGDKDVSSDIVVFVVGFIEVVGGVIV